MVEIGVLRIISEEAQEKDAGGDSAGPQGTSER
jgi:hypothetical protein